MFRLALRGGRLILLFWKHVAKQKHKIRELAMQILYQWDFNNDADDPRARESLGQSGAKPEVAERALAYAHGAWDYRLSADEHLNRLAPHWPAHRQPAVDRAILRLALWEMGHEKTPPKVVIDEAIELGKEYSTENSASFINGVLDAAFKESQTLIQPIAPPPTEQ
jgi:transcription antitermination protein NusB